MLIDWNTMKIKAPTNNTHYMVYQDDIEMTEHWVNSNYLMFLVLKYVQNFSKTLVGCLVSCSIVICHSLSKLT